MNNSNMLLWHFNYFKIYIKQASKALSYARKFVCNKVFELFVLIYQTSTLTDAGYLILVFNRKTHCSILNVALAQKYQDIFIIYKFIHIQSEAKLGLQL